MVSGIFQQIFGSGTAFAMWFVEVVQALIGLFYVPGAEGKAGEFTFLGAMAIVFLLVWLTRMAIGWVRSFVKH